MDALRLLSRLAPLLVLLGCGVTPDGLSSGNPDGGAFVLPANCTKMDPSSTEYLFCAGTFAAGEAQKLCPAKYTTTGDPLSPALLTLCDMNFTLISGNVFMAADAGDWADPSMPLSANSCTAKSGWLPVVRGCGAKQNATEFAATDCDGWPHGLVCSKAPGWSCPDGNLKTASNSNPTDGVVCRRTAP